MALHSVVTPVKPPGPSWLDTCGSVGGRELLLQPEGGGGTPYNGLYGKSPPERGTFFKLQVYERVGIS